MSFITSRYPSLSYKAVLFFSLSLLALIYLSACATTNPAVNSVKSTQYAATDIHHIVLVWFKAGTDKAFIDKVKQESLALNKIPGVKQIHAGKAIPSERKIVDDSFDLGLHMLFANEAEMNAYLKHPDHVAFVKQIKPQIEKLLVYDF